MKSDDDAFLAEIAAEPSKWSKVIEKHGPWFFMALIVTTAFYVFTLKPMQVERTMLINDLHTSNQHASEVADKMVGAMESIRDELAKQTEQRKEAIDMMGKFAVEVREDHPAMDEKLDQILEQTKE